MEGACASRACEGVDPLLNGFTGVKFTVAARPPDVDDGFASETAAKVEALQDARNGGGNLEEGEMKRAFD